MILLWFLTALIYVICCYGSMYSLDSLPVSFLARPVEGLCAAPHCCFVAPQFLNVLSSLRMKSDTFSVSLWEVCQKSWAASILVRGSSHPRKAWTISSKGNCPSLARRFHSCNALPRRWPAS